MKEIALFLLTLAFYGCSMGTLLASMVNNDTYLIGLAIFELMIANRMGKRFEEVEK